MGAAASAHKKRRQVEAEGAKLPKDLRTHSLSSKQQAGLAAFRSNGAAIASAPASEPSNIGHYYCGLPRAPKNESLLGSDPHQAGWLAGKWTASSDDIERTDALRKLGILLTVRPPPPWQLPGRRDGSAAALARRATPRLTARPPRLASRAVPPPRAGARGGLRPDDGDGCRAL